MSDVVWSDPEWLHFFPLNALTVLDYFARSSFYDAGCNNEKLRQQGLDISKLPTLPPGVEFVIHDTQEPHLYVIRKQQRHSPASATPLCFFYVLDGHVYQAPTLHASLASRLSRCLFNVKAAFHRIQQDIDPLQSIRADEADAEQPAGQAPEVVPPAKRWTAEERQRAARIDGILHSVVSAHAQLLPLPPEAEPLPGAKAEEQSAASQPEVKQEAQPGA